MAAKGFIITDSRQFLEFRYHGYLEWINGMWRCITENQASGDNWFFFRNDGTTPATPGDTGGWTVGLNVNTKESGHTNLSWDEDNDRGCSLGRHATDDLFTPLNLDGSGNPKIDGSAFNSGYVNSDKVNCIQGNDGRMYAVRLNGSGGIEVRSTNTARTTLNSVLTITPTGTVANEFIGVIRATDGTDHYVGIFYSDVVASPDEGRLLWIKDGVDPTVAGNWTDVKAWSDASIANDDQFDSCFGELDGESFTRFLLCYKTSANNIRALKGSWSGGTPSFEATVAVVSSKTRPACYFSTSGDAFVCYLNGTGGGSTTIVQIKDSLGDMDGTLSFANETDIIESVSGTENMGHCKMAASAQPSTSNAMVIASQHTAQRETWFFEVNVVDPPAGANVAAFVRAQQQGAGSQTDGT